MPELDPVTEQFLADTLPYIQALDAATGAADRFAEANLRAMESVDLLQGAVNDFSTAGMTAKVAVANTALGGMRDRLAEVAAAQVAGSAVTAAAVTRTTAAATATEDAARRGGVAFRAWGFQIRNWGNVLHWVVAGGAEILAVTIPAAVAAASGAFVMYQGAVESVTPHLQSLFTATEATSNMFHKTTGDVLGLGHAFQAAQNAADPNVYQLLGDYVDGARSHMAGLAQAGLQVSRVLDEFGAKVVTDLQGPLGGTVNKLLANMVPDLVGLGQIFGNLGHAVLSFAGAMPGLAEVLLRTADAASRVVLWVSQLPAPLITAVMAFEEFNRWGGLTVTILGRMGLASSTLAAGMLSPVRAMGVLSSLFKALPMLTAMGISNLGSLMAGYGRFGGVLGRAGMAVRGFGADMTDAVAAIPVWQAALGALALGGLGFLIYKAVTARSAVQQLTDAMQANVQKASNFQAMQLAASNISDLQQQMGQAAAQAHALGSAVAGSNTAVLSAARYGDVLRASVLGQGLAYQAFAGQVQQYRAGIVQQIQDIANVATGARYLASTYHTDLAGAMALATQAGVHLSAGILGNGQAARIARQQIQALVDGYRAMGQPLGAIGKDMDALAIQSGLANTKVSQLNQAWDQFMQNLTGGTSGLGAISESIQNIGQVTSSSIGKLGQAQNNYTLTTSQFASSLRHFTGVGAQAWQNFDNIVGGSMPQLIDWLRTAGAEGAITGTRFSQAVLDMTAQMVPFAARSKTAQAELLGLAQQAGLNISTFPQLQQAIKDSHASMDGLSKIIGQTTVSMSDMGQVAQNLGTVMNSALTQAISNASLKASGFYTATQNLTAAMARYGAGSPQAIAAASQVTSAWDRAQAMAAQVAKEAHNAQQQIDGIKSKTVELHFQIMTSGHVPAGASGWSFSSGTPGERRVALNARGTSAASPGLSLVGEEGPELMMMRGGEQVVPADQTRHLLRLAALTRRVPGYAAGTSGSSSLMHQIERELSVLVLRVTSASSPAGVRRYTDNLLSSIKQAGRAGDIGHGTESGLARFLERDNRRLETAARDRSRIVSAIHKAEQYAANVTSTAAGTASLSAIMSAAGPGPVTSSVLLAQMRIGLAGIRKFSGDIRRLEKLGLDKGLLNQIIQMGPVQGDQVAMALINGPMANIRALDSTEAQVRQASRIQGRAAAGAMFDTGRHAGQGFLSGLRAQEHAIDREIRHIAQSIVRTFRRELGIHSPSSVTMPVGHAVVDGVIHGARQRMPALDTALRSAAGHIPSALSSAAGGAAGGGSGDMYLHLTIQLPSPKDNYRSVQTQSLRVNRRNSDNRLALKVR